jgi:hypothetical protein
MAEATERTDGEDDQRHSHESEEALRQPRDVDQDERERPPQPGVTPAPHDEDAPSGATVEGGLVRQTVPVA